MSVVAGIHAVRHALDSGRVEELLVEKGKRHPRINELIHLARREHIRVAFRPREGLDALAEGARHQGVVARLRDHDRVNTDFSSWLDGLDPAMQPVVLVLDQITDPHNLGACIRTAEASGCNAVIVPRHHSAHVSSPVVAKSACGALARIPVFEIGNLARCLQALKEKGFWVIALCGEAESSLYQVSFGGAVALVAGSEGKGVRRLVRETSDQMVRIPMPGSVESLNVSVAVGVALFEIVRQRSS
ncbi:MAG: 23S rRNA (guanosine(2251)-2'-O)-methyltransferase RlmB [Zetaproteobacteria bacterium]|nr:MAG: 23S rRNA (guanosine(2251)-2'-O)-methyltransferase RlmB [Zetaproteobacteria bacterium]